MRGVTSKVQESCITRFNSSFKRIELFLKLLDRTIRNIKDFRVLCYKMTFDRFGIAHWIFQLWIDSIICDPGHERDHALQWLCGDWIKPFYSA